ncbi:hypothetical protein C8Q76DRAFT_792439 [Earliella scabrosa]|nr:hypothetical protein C8Q76DRAFT_792439 [Earliella scabrosa]
MLHLLAVLRYPDPTLIRLLAIFSYAVASCLIVYHTVYAMWDSFENPPAFVNRNSSYIDGSGDFANVTVSLISLPVSNKAANSAVVATAIVPAAFLTVFLELEEHHINVCSAPHGVALAFADSTDLKIFAASLEGAVNVGGKP